MKLPAAEIERLRQALKLAGIGSDGALAQAAE
jgi:hypothetical protein